MVSGALKIIWLSTPTKLRTYPVRFAKKIVSLIPAMRSEGVNPPILDAPCWIIQA